MEATPLNPAKLALPVALALAFVVLPFVSALSVPASDPEELDVGTALDAALARASAAMNDVSVQGRTASGWLGFVQGEIATPTPAALPDADLTTEVLALYDVMGLVASHEERAAIARDAAALDPATAAAFAGLLAVVVDAYAEQAPIAARVVERAHAFTPFEMGEILHGGLYFTNLERGYAQDVVSLVTPEESLAMQATAARVLDAVSAFRLAVPLEAEPRGGGGGAPLFRDPNGLVMLGGAEDTTFPRTGMFKDAVLVADVGGDDLYQVAAGAACPDPLNTISTCNGLVLGVNVDLAGDDTYTFAGQRSVAQGAASTGAIGILLDDAGNDAYRTEYRPEKDSVLFYYIQGISQGAGQAGLGILLDREGNDHYDFYGTTTTPGRQVFVLAQGYGGVGGTGLLVDLVGDDRYEALVDVPAGADFSGVYTLGTALYAAVGIVYDAAGNDYYYGNAIAPQSDYYAQGFGAFAAMGIQIDFLGDDEYLALETSTNESFGQSLNCAYGTAFFSGVGLFLDLAGDDSYYTETVSWQNTGRPAGMSEGWSEASWSTFLDVSGDDDHVIVSYGKMPMATGRGIGSHVGVLFLVSRNVAGLGAAYLDTGGLDTYVGAVPSADGAVWNYGVDTNTVPDLAALGIPGF